MFTFLVILQAAFGAILLCFVAYLLLLLAAALMGKKRFVQPPSNDSCTFTVVIPAHNEEMVITETLQSLRAQDYPAERFQVVVVADNCTDSTSDLAHAAGARVLERTNTSERGKGYALAWAIRELGAELNPKDAYVIVDADTWVAPDFLRLMAARVASQSDSRGFCALQGRYGVLNAAEGWRAALMSGAFDLFNHVKPMGRETLKLGVGLKGNGMVFTRSLMEALPWLGDSITEDIDYGLELARKHGVRVAYVPEAVVLAQMPTTADQARSQRERWELGRYELLKTKAFPLLGEAVKKRRAPLWDAGFDLIVPPLGELFAMVVVWAVGIEVLFRAGVLLSPRPWSWLCAGTFVALLVYVIAGFAVAGAKPEAYFALLRAPFYVVWKLCLYAGKLFTRRSGGPSEWVRTERAPISGPPTKPAKPTDN